jgi:hypothetical protein
MYAYIHSLSSICGALGVSTQMAEPLGSSSV